MKRNDMRGLPKIKFCMRLLFYIQNKKGVSKIKGNEKLDKIPSSETSFGSVFRRSSWDNKYWMISCLSDWDTPLEINVKEGALQELKWTIKIKRRIRPKKSGDLHIYTRTI